MECDWISDAYLLLKGKTGKLHCGIELVNVVLTHAAKQRHNQHRGPVRDVFPFRGGSFGDEGHSGTNE